MKPGVAMVKSTLLGGDMTEDDLLAGITEALGFGGWRWTHIRRSDGVTVGDPGLPDIIAAHPSRTLILAWELKAARGVVSPDQLAWLFALGRVGGDVDARIIRPHHYDPALEVILRGAKPADVFDL